MPFIPTPNGIKAEMRYTWDGQKVENVFWFLASTPTPSASDLSQVAQMLYDWWEVHILPIQAAEVTLREIYVTDQSSISGAVHTFTGTLPQTGGNVNGTVSNNVTLCISLRTAQRGRSYRGRSFIIGLTRNVVSHSRVIPVALTAWQAAYDALVSEAAAAGRQLCVASFRNAGDWRAQGVLTPVVDAVIVDDVVDTQRRRLPGRGE